MDVLRTDSSAVVRSSCSNSEKIHRLRLSPMVDQNPVDVLGNNYSLCPPEIY